GCRGHMAKKPRIADPDAIRAARNAIAEIRESRLRAKSDLVTTIATGVPRRGRDGNYPDDFVWKPSKPPPEARASEPPPKPVETEPPKPTVWKYVWIQTRAPRSDNDCGAIIEAQYAIAADGVLYLDDMSGKPIASQNSEATITRCMWRYAYCAIRAATVPARPASTPTFRITGGRLTTKPGVSSLSSGGALAAAPGAATRSHLSPPPLP